MLVAKLHFTVEHAGVFLILQSLLNFVSIIRLRHMNFLTCDTNLNTPICTVKSKFEADCCTY